MSQRVLFVLFLLLCYHTSWLVCAEYISSSAAKRTIVFQDGVTKVPYEENNGTIVEKPVHSFRVPSLVDVDGVLVAIADVRYDRSSDNSFIETMAAYSLDNGITWTTQIAIKSSRVDVVSRVVDPTVIVKGNKIYVFVGSYKTSREYWERHPGLDWEPLLAVGEVKNITKDGKESKTLEWNKPEKLVYERPSKVGLSAMQQFLGGVGVAIVTKNGTLVFPIQIQNVNYHIFSTIMYSVDDGKTWKIANGVTESGCREPVVVEWEGKLILNTRVRSGYRKVFESTDMGETWTEALGTLSRVWGNSPSRKGPGSQSAFIRVEIEGKPVMLFTNPLNYKGDFERDRLHLWLTDNNRIFDIGQISAGDENAPYSSLLYRDGKLYCLHEVNNAEKYSLVFLELKDELDLIKSVVKTWIDQDKKFSDICTPIDPTQGSRESGCGLPFPTSGLVGFLSDKVDNFHWKDAYRCVDAQVTYAERVPNGLKFRGGYYIGARWPVGLQGQNQRYFFVNRVFTLVATVRIDEEPQSEDYIPLLGLSAVSSDTDKVIGLSYSRGGHWLPMFGNYFSSTSETWKLNETYQILLTVRNRVGSIYINGKLLEGSGQLLRYEMWWKSTASHFYIAGNMNDGLNLYGHVTVTNVLLYNRELNSSEIKTLLLNKDVNVDAPNKPTEVVTRTTTSSTSSIQTPSLTQGMTNGNVMPTLGEENKLTAERLQNPSTDIISGSNTAVSAPISGDVYNMDKEHGVKNDITANTDVNVMNGNGAVNRTGNIGSSSSDMQISASTKETENPEITTVVNNRNSNNHGTSIGGEKNRINNVSPTQRTESEKKESPKTTIQSSREAPVIPTERTQQGIDISNDLVYKNLVSPNGDGSLYFTSLQTLLFLLVTTIVMTMF